MKENTKQTKKQALQSELSQYFERVKARKELCSHLPLETLSFWTFSKSKADGERIQKPLCRALATQEFALWVKAGAKCDEKCLKEMGVTSEQIYQHELAKTLSKEQARQQARQIGDLLDAIYILESECFKTHEALVKLAQSMSALDIEDRAGFYKTKKMTGIVCGFVNVPIYNILKSYEISGWKMEGVGCVVDMFYVGIHKYDLHAYDESALEQILLMKLCLKDNQTWLDESVAWLDECILRQKDFVPYSKYGVTKRADFEKFTPDEQERLEQIAQKAARIQRLIVSDFTKDGVWVDTQTLIDKARFAPLWLL